MIQRMYTHNINIKMSPRPYADAPEEGLEHALEKTHFGRQQFAWIMHAQEANDARIQTMGK